MSEQQLALAPAEPAVELELVDGTIADELADAVVIAPSAPALTELEKRNLFGEAERIAARAASASTRRQYARSSAPSAIGSRASSAGHRWSPTWTRTRSPPTPATSRPLAAVGGVRQRRRPRACIYQ